MAMEMTACSPSITFHLRKAHTLDLPQRTRPTQHSADIRQDRFGPQSPTPFPFYHQNTKTSTISTLLGPKENTYDHTHWKTRDPVRSPIDKPVRARLVVGSVTTSESLVLYVFLVATHLSF